MFTVELLEDARCRFSDKDEFGSWQCEREYVVFEKPKGLFKDTLYFSAKLRPASAGELRTRLVNGSVSRFVRANTSANQGASEDGLVEFGTFGGYLLDDKDAV
uniref:Uncharacterized protein n=1 Tax=Calcidiscus leptoporus TaxID=127549 RepID=A0A7S0NY21_9EUKA|mmetsp:Transcript_39933/g.93263  ORF Transcript_39933/g.93263 Transcript_39933/m.93263 type:complete len:103 (+) Transcript_39933:3-311(+)